MRALVSWSLLSLVCVACSDDDNSPSPDAGGHVEEEVDSSLSHDDAGSIDDSSVVMPDARAPMLDSSIGAGGDSATDAMFADSAAIDAALDSAIIEVDAAVEVDAADDDDAGDEPPSADAIDICGTVVSIGDHTATGSEWIIDVATRAGNTDTNSFMAEAMYDYLDNEYAELTWIDRPAGCDGGECIDHWALAEQLFVESDTARAVLVGLPYTLSANGEGAQGITAVSETDLRDMRDKVNEYRGADVLVSAAAVMPNDRIDLQLERMDELADQHVAWLLDTSYSPESVDDGYFLDDSVGTQVIERGIALERPIFLVRKGMRLGATDLERAGPRDIGPAAVAHPAGRFVVLQSAFEHGLRDYDTSRPSNLEDFGWGPGVGQWPEGPYDEIDADVQALYPLDRGVNSLIDSLRTSGIGPGENVYASLDGVWAELFTRPIEAAHVLGKLLLYVGEDNVLWGTDSVFYGGPNPQLDAFRTFEIPEAMRVMYGYPELTPERKAKILGLNAARLFCLPPPAAP